MWGTVRPRTRVAAASGAQGPLRETPVVKAAGIESRGDPGLNELAGELQIYKYTYTL